ncbi:hypothetical protein QBC46DRAFT_421050 [Diplogelasinospora grovesii]|uniref:Uncharacterized protein n=1 Tax=Diplogelasinospora grovesii TaxID=303347 RepID=A0AAN6MYR3_9PEZI|nr:hypothetical protein QBC46DRAFT_421050 [Diplogelasinospora grovesii]
MPLGFHTLHEVRQGSVPEDGLVDIVAVHDVHEDSLAAWTDPVSLANWLRDFLPEHIRVARVVAYGYNASAAALFASDAPETIQRMAESLVQELRANRHFAGTLRRPIIFVCHGLGGVLVKKSLIYSSTRTAPKVAHLWDQFVSTFAILFFGTPHGRTSKRDWLDFASISGRTRRSVLQAMDRLRLTDDGDPQLPELVDNDFAPLVKQFHMFFFWEELPTLLGNRWGYVVDSKSAVPKLDKEAAGIHATHADMVKFKTRELSDYRTVVAALATYCAKAPTIITHRWKQAELALRQLRAGEAWELGGFGFDVHLEEPFRHRDICLSRQFHLPGETTPTYIGRQGLLKTLRDSFFPPGRPGVGPTRRSFVVFGMGGSGKTELCSKYATDNKHEYTAVFTIRAASNETIKESFCRIGEVAGLEATESSGRHFLSQQTEPWLLIIDNADDRTLELRSLFPSSDAAHILVTTRVRDFSREGTLGSLEVKGLEEGEALQLLLTKADIPQPWDPLTTKTGNLITRALGYLALALIQAGNCIYRGVCELGGYLDIHASARKKLRDRTTFTQPDKTDDAITVVYSTFDISLRALLKEETTARQDASDLLKIIAFYRFELIPLDIFSRAAANRSKALKDSQTASGTLVSRFTRELLRRLESPTALPGFLKGRNGELEMFRINWAIAELQSLSFVRSDGRYLSLHPLIHSWARDSLTRPERNVWARIALNTLMESISLPPESSSEADGEFHTDVLPHLDACLTENGDPLPPSTREMGKLRLQIAKFLQPTLLLIVRDQVQRAAKCGWVSAERGQFEKASRHLQMVKDMLVRLLGTEDDKTMAAMLGLAGVYWGLGRLEEAIDLQQSVVDTRSRTLGLDNEETLDAMNHLGRSYWLHGQYREALELQQLTADRMKAALGPTHPRTLEALDNLGVTLGAWYRYQESAAVHEEVLSVRKEALGETHLDTLATKANLAMALLDLGRLEEAKSAMTEVFHQRQKQLGKEHPWTLWALCYLARVDTELGLFQEAEDMLDWGIAAGVRSLGDRHLGVLMGRGRLAVVYARTNRLHRAEELTLKTLEVLEATRGTAHPDCVYALWKLARLYVLKGSHTKAAEACQLGLQRADMRITREHPLAKDLEDLLKTVSTSV